jgi:prepilin-type N-terminal cleavage/methylation domain-containing protein
MKHTKSRARRGFTLVEAAIGIVIVSIGAIATLTLLMFTRLHNAEQQERARAHQIVSQEMEQRHADLYTNLTPGTTVTIWDNGTPDDTTDDTVGTLFIYVRDADGNLITQTPIPWERVEVEVTLAWNGRGRRAGIELRESLVTYMSP